MEGFVRCMVSIPTSGCFIHGIASVAETLPRNDSSIKAANTSLRAQRGKQRNLNFNSPSFGGGQGEDDTANTSLRAQSGNSPSFGGGRGEDEGPRGKDYCPL